MKPHRPYRLGFDLSEYLSDKERHQIHHGGAKMNYNTEEAAQYLNVTERKFKYLIYRKYSGKVPKSIVDGKNVFTRVSLDLIATWEWDDAIEKAQSKQEIIDNHITTIKGANWSKVPRRDLTYFVTILKRNEAI